MDSAYTEPTSSDRERVHASAEILPRVSVVLPIRNEIEHIEACLQRLLEQDYPHQALEILVVDGMSEDGTPEAVRRVQARQPAGALRLLQNPQRTVPAALNAGIRAATGEVIVRMDGHTVPANDYVSRCVRALQATGAANVGGVIEAVGSTPFGWAVAAASTHPFGAGNARYRLGGEAGFVDTVPFGAYRRDLFVRIGLFDESLVRNQDAEFNLRIHAAGGRVYFDPTIRSVYTPRSSTRALWSQYFQYGWWRVETARRRPGSLRSRQLIPPAFLAVLIVVALAAPWTPLAAAGLATALAAYAIVLTMASLCIARPPATPALVMLAFVTIHTAWSLGFLLNLLSNGRYPRRADPPRVPTLTEPRTTSAPEGTP